MSLNASRRKSSYSLSKSGREDGLITLEQTNTNILIDVIGKNRRCTDTLFLLFICSAWIVMAGIGAAAYGFIDSKYIPKGDPKRLTHGMDYQGNICGVSNVTLEHGKNIKDLEFAYYLPSGLPVCVDSCPQENDYLTFYCEYGLQNEVTSDMTNHTGLQYVSEMKCMPKVKSKSLLGYCYPNEGIDRIIEATSDAAIAAGDKAINGTLFANSTGGDETKQFFEEALGDLQTSGHAVFGFGIGASVVLGFVFLLLMRTPGLLHIVLWTFITIIFCGLGGCSYYMRETSRRWEDEGLREEREIKGILWLAYTFAGLAIIWFVLICWMRKRIVLAVDCIKEASKAIGKMPLIIFYPVSQAVTIFIFISIWAYIMVYLAASGEMVPTCLCPSVEGISNFFDSSNSDFVNDELLSCDDGCFLFKSFEYTANTKYAGFYMLFIWFWTAQFVTAVGEIIVAMAVSTYFFTRDKCNIGNKTFFHSISLTSKFHLGTAAFGSLIIAVIQIIRSIIVYIEKKAGKNEGSRVAKIILSSIRCCLWCVEKFMKFINKQAYIQTAMMGFSFCSAAKASFALLLKNVLRVATVSFVSEFVLFIGKLFIVVSTTLLTYLYLDKELSGELNGLWLPTLVTAIISYCVAAMFSEVFGMTISTILQCYMKDEDLFDPEERFARQTLVNTIERTQASMKGHSLVYPNIKS